MHSVGVEKERREREEGRKGGREGEDTMEQVGAICKFIYKV